MQELVEEKNTQIKYRNVLNTSSFLTKLDAVELDIFFAICSQLKDKQQSSVKLTFEQLKKLSGYTSTSNTRFLADINSVYENIMRIQTTIVIENREVTFNLFSKFDKPLNTTKEDENYIEIGINNEFSFIFNDFTREFTSFELKKFTSLSSTYTKQLYRLLKQFTATGYYKVSVEKFRTLLNIPNSYRMSDIDRQIIKKAQQELVETTEILENLRVNKVKAKKGNKIEYLEFFFKEKEDEGEKLPHIPMYNWLESSKK